MSSLIDLELNHADVESKRCWLPMARWTSGMVDSRGMLLPLIFNRTYSQNFSIEVG